MSAAATSPPELPQHVVTAVVVSHDGERWLPEVLAALAGQNRPVQDVIAADTGSADRSADLVTEAFGAERVLHLARRSGFGTAVAEAARTVPVLTPDDLSYLRRPSGWDPVSRTWRDDDLHHLPELPYGEPVHWLWLLHDDSAPEPDALAELLRQADQAPDAAILGAKLRSWYDQRQLLETGVTIAASGRRWTGLDRREQDQGQHDQERPVLAVSTAGMLIRRDAFERLGGFDRHIPLMRDDVDLCWRAHLAGLSVRIAPGAVLRHAEASSRERRAVDCGGRLGGRPHRVDKAAATYTLLTNTRRRLLPWVLLRLVVGTVLRVLGYLLGKAPGRALDEASGLLSTLLRPGRVLAGRGRRRTTASLRVDPAGLRPLFPPPGATLKATAEQALGAVSRRRESDTGAGRHGAVESGPTDDDADMLEVEQFAKVRQLARRPGPLLVLLLLLAAAAASRELFGSGALAGGALLPAPSEIGEVWARYRESWQPLGSGGVEAAPPYLALLALLATLALGSTGAVLTVLFSLAVPLAGVSAYLASRGLVTSRLLRAWGSVAYAVLPAMTGAIAGGWIGSVVLAIVLPVLARCAVAAAGLLPGGRMPWRAAWGGALLLAVVTAFTPVVWAIGVVLALGALVRPPAARRAPRAARLIALVGAPVVVLAPWSLTVLTSPSRLFDEVGLDVQTDPAGPLALLGANPGGPGTPGGWLLLGLLGAALAALLRRERRGAITTAWVSGLVALAFAALTGDAHWAGPTTLVYGLALLAAALLGADGARHRVAEQSFGWRQPVAVLVAGCVALGTVASLAGWVVRGADGPLHRADPVQVPAFVAQESGTDDQPRTLVLSGEGASEEGEPLRLNYALLRGAGARLGDADLTDLMPEDRGLSTVVADLVSGAGADQTERLGGYAIRYILVHDDDASAEGLHRVLNSTPGLAQLSQEDDTALWRVETDVARAMIMPPGDEPDTQPETVASGPVEIDTEVPDGPAGRTLRLAEDESDGWQATLDGEPLTPTQLDGWAQGFELPEAGGRLEVTHETGAPRTIWVWTQVFLFLVLTVLALPGRRRHLDDDLPEEPSAAPGGAPAAATLGEEPDAPASAGPLRHEEVTRSGIPEQGVAAGERASPSGPQQSETAQYAGAHAPVDAAAQHNPPPEPDRPEPYFPAQQEWAGGSHGYPQHGQSAYLGYDGPVSPAEAAPAYGGYPAAYEAHDGHGAHDGYGGHDGYRVHDGYYGGYGTHDGYGGYPEYGHQQPSHGTPQQGGPHQSGWDPAQGYPSPPAEQDQERHDPYRYEDPYGTAHQHGDGSGQR